MNKSSEDVEDEDVQDEEVLLRVRWPSPSSILTFRTKDSCGEPLSGHYLGVPLAVD